MRTVLITPENPLTIPLGMGALLRWNVENTHIAAREISVEGFTLPIAVDITTNQTPNPECITDETGALTTTIFLRDWGIRRLQIIDATS